MQGYHTLFNDPLATAKLPHLPISQACHPNPVIKKICEMVDDF
jgi:hypothetical protein